jgi:CrcB protein
MQQILLIALGGSLGAVARYGLSTLVYQLTSESFPWGTLVVNVSGSFLIGALVELFDSVLIAPPWRNFLTIGFVGAYTTFSTYSLETINLLRDAEFRLAAINVVASNIAGLLFAVLGIYSSRLLVKFLSVIP